MPEPLTPGCRCEQLEIDGTGVIACHGGKLHEGDIEAIRDFAEYLRGRGRWHQGKPIGRDRDR